MLPPLLARCRPGCVSLNQRNRQVHVTINGVPVSRKEAADSGLVGAAAGQKSDSSADDRQSRCVSFDPVPA